MSNITTSDNLLERFDANEDILDYFDLNSVELPNCTQKPISAMIPLWIVETMDEEAKFRGVTRKAIMNGWLADRALQEKERRLNIAHANGR